MSVLFLKVAGTTALLFLFFLVIAILFVERYILVYGEWENQPIHHKVLVYVLIGLGMSTFTSIIGAFIAKIWGF